MPYTSIFVRRWLVLLLVLCGWCASPVLAQTVQPQGRQSLHCATPDFTSEQLKKFASYVKQAETQTNQARKAAGGVIFLGIKPWKTSGYWTTDEVVTAINILNAKFASSSIQFYIVNSGIGIFTAPHSQTTLTYPADEANLLNQYFDATAINVYFTGTINYCAYPPCVSTAGLTPGLTDLVSLGDRPTDIANPAIGAKKDDYIMISYVSDGNTLPHEMGHYFGLLHTDQGAFAANCQDRERPIGGRAAGDTDRGDLIDDTDADPFGLYLANNINPPFSSSSCAFTGSAIHCDATLPSRTYVPPVNNVMSPWGSGFVALGNICAGLKVFSPHQVARMQSFLLPRLNTANQYQLQNGVPGVAVGPVVSLSLTDASLRITPVDLTITVADVPGKVGYILERATDAGFSTYIVANSTAETGGHVFRHYIPVPTPNTTWYFRVRATNGIVYSNVVSYSCAPTATFSGSQTVTDGQSATYTVALTGTPPWTVQVGGQTYSNVTTSPLQVVTNPFQALQNTYTQITTGGSVTNACGTAPLSGSASVTVLGICPVLSVAAIVTNISCGSLTGSAAIYMENFTSPESCTSCRRVVRNTTTGTSYTATYNFLDAFSYNNFGIFFYGIPLTYQFVGVATGLTAGQYTVDFTDINGCPSTPYSFTLIDRNTISGSTAVLSGPANNRIVKGQQTSIRVELTGTSPWTVVYSGRGGKQYAERNITTSSYDIAVLPDSSTTYRLVTVSNSCGASAVSGSASIIVVPALTNLEYFFDTEPGIGQATSIAVGFNQTIANQTIGLPVPTLSVGLHTLFMRGKDGNGYWGGVTAQPFIALGGQSSATNPIVGVEYSYDGATLPRTFVPVSATTNQAIALPIALSQTAGLHTLNTRVKDGQGRWSAYTITPFIVLGTGSNANEAVTQLDYYVDTDPGLGQATQLAYTPTSGAALSLSLNAAGLSAGTHTLVVRAKSSRNRWSINYVRSFLVQPGAGGINRIEYFFDTANPGFGSGQPFTLDAPGSTTVTGQALAGTSSLSVGAHSLNVRAQQGSGPGWSTTRTASFTVTPCATALATLYGSSTTTTDQVASISVLIGGNSPFSLTANGQTIGNITTSAASFTVALTVPGTYTLTPQSVGLAVANSCGTGQVGGSAVVTVLQGTNCTTMQTVKAGSWNDPTVWSCGRLPVVSDAVLIRHAVTVPAGFVSHAQKVGFEVNGKLSWGSASRLLLGL